MYSYIYNTPVMYTDSTGHSWESFWKTTFGVVAGIAIGAVAVTAIIASGGTLLVPALIGLGIGAGTSLIGQGLANVSNGIGFFEDVNWMSVGLGGVSGFAFATGVGVLFGAIGIGVLSSAGSSAFEGESWGNIGINALLGGAAAGIGYGAGKFLGNHIFKNSDLVFNDIFQMTRLDTNIVNGAVIAFRATWYTFIPAVTPGITRGIIKYLGN